MSLKVATGDTIYDIIMSVDTNNNPVTGSTFDIDVFRDGSAETGVTVSVSLTDSSTGAFTSNWSADTVGNYQVYYKNSITNVIFITDTYEVVLPNDIGPKVFVGL